MSIVWFDDFKQLVRGDQVTQFWPSKKQTPEDRVNAASRFIIYATCALYLSRRDPRVFVLGVMALAILYTLHENGMIEEEITVGRPARVEKPVSETSPKCRFPTEDNPFGNTLVTHQGDEATACYYPTVKNFVKHHAEDRIQFDGGRSRTALPMYQRKAAGRQFYSAPSPFEDQTAFAEALYGPKNGKLCRDTPGVCDPNARGSTELGLGCQACGP